MESCGTKKIYCTRFHKKSRHKNVSRISIAFYLMYLYRNTSLNVIKMLVYYIGIIVCPVSSNMQHCFHVYFAYFKYILCSMSCLRLIELWRAFVLSVYDWNFLYCTVIVNEIWRAFVQRQIGLLLFDLIYWLSLIQAF